MPRSRGAVKSARKKTPVTAPDRALLERARRGDQAALGLLLAENQGRIFRFAMKMCRSEQDAEDVLQETMIAVARTLPDFRGASTLSTWLFTIARSFCIKKRRKRKYAGEEQALSEAGPLVDPARGPEEALAGRQLQLALTQAIAALEPKYREVLILRDVEGLSAQEVSDVLSLRVEAVKSRLHRARLAVRAAMSPKLGVPDEAPGPDCPDVLSLFSRYLEGDISREVCAEMEQHLDSCPRCERTCASLKESLRLCRTTPAPKVPKKVQLSIKAALLPPAPGVSRRRGA